MKLLNQRNSLCLGLNTSTPKYGWPHHENSHPHHPESKEDYSQSLNREIRCRIRTHGLDGTNPIKSGSEVWPVQPNLKRKNYMLSLQEKGL